ncbi:MAG: nucleotidyltransferase family protein [bacterium]|nr:nucleotidyltransferase family protein [bacterium]
MIGGIVLAAGLSERMVGDVPKQLLPLGDVPIVAVTVGHAEASSLDQVVVVTGHRGAEVAAAVSDSRAIVVANPDYRQGNMASFRAGFLAQAECDAYVILLADMPTVTSEMINRFVDLWTHARPWAAVARYREGPAHPLLLSADAIAEAIAMEGAKGVWRFLAAAPAGQVAEVLFDQATPPDINTVEDYERVTP